HLIRAANPHHIAALRRCSAPAHCRYRADISAKSPQSAATTWGGKRPDRSRCGQSQREGSMKPSSLTLMMIAAAIVVGAGTRAARAADPTALGLWEQVDEKSGKAESWFKIAERNGVYEGTLVKIFAKPGEDENMVCDKCEGAERGAPLLGLALIKG